MTDLYETSVEPSDVLDAQRVSDVRGAVEHEDAQRLHTLLDPLHPADIADLLEQVSDSLRAGILRLWKWSTLMHSVAPIRIRERCGWCTWPKKWYLGENFSI